MDSDQSGKLKLYIATKMRGLSREEIMKKLQKIAILLGYNPEYIEYVNMLSEEKTAGMAPVQCLGESIKRLPLADKVYIEKYKKRAAFPVRNISATNTKFHIPKYF